MAEDNLKKGKGIETSSRLLWTVSLVLVLGAIAFWGTSKLTWFAQYRDAGVRGVVLETQSGAERASMLIPLAVLAIAGVAGVIAAHGRLRSVLGFLLAFAGLAGCWMAVQGVRFSDQPGLPVTGILLARLIALVGGILLVCGGLLIVAGAKRMPRLGARYSVSTENRPTRDRSQDPETELWKELSDGRDPTVQQ